MLRLARRSPGGELVSPAVYICQRCQQSSVPSLASLSPYRPTLLQSRGYVATAPALQYMQQRGSRYDQNDDVDNDQWRGPRGGQNNRRTQRYDDNRYDEEVRRPRRGYSNRYLDQNPESDINSIMANARSSEFSRTLHRMRREEYEKKDQALQILNQREKPATFQDSQLRPVLKKAIAKAFPNVTLMSPTQRNMLVLLQEGYSLCVTGPPASGKSFTVAAWLLQLMRSTRSEIQEDGRIKKIPSTTGIIFVPTVDILFQYMNWLETLLNAFGDPSKKAPPLDTVFQGFTRWGHGNTDVEREQAQRLLEHPGPHIIVTTPMRFMDLINDPETRNSIDLTNLKTIVIDEVDAMINQRPTPKKLDELTHRKKIRQERNWQKPSPLEACIDYIVEKREKAANQENKHAPALQFCMISPNLSPVLKSKVEFTKQWLGMPYDNSKANTLLNLGIQNYPKLYDRERISPMYSIPARIKHHALSVDITTGMMRDIPTLEGDVLMRTEDEQAEIEKYVNVLKTHHDPRAAVMTNDALAVEAAQEEMLMEEEKDTYLRPYKPAGGLVPGEEIKDILTNLQNDFRHTGVSRQTTAEIMEVLLERDNYPERVILFVSPIGSRPKYVETLREAGFRAEQLRWDSALSHNIPLGRTDLEATTVKSGQPGNETKRTKEDTVIWISSSVGTRGLDTPGFTHAYILVPTTSHSRYLQMAGRVARYPFTKQIGNLLEPEGQVTSIFLEEPVGRHKNAPMVDGVVQVDSPVEAFAWRRIHRMYGLCGAKVEKYFGPEEEYGVMLRSPQSHLSKFPEMDEEVPWDGRTVEEEAQDDTAPASTAEQAKSIPAGPVDVLDDTGEVAFSTVSNNRIPKPPTPKREPEQQPLGDIEWLDESETQGVETKESSGSSQVISMSQDQASAKTAASTNHDPPVEDQDVEAGAEEATDVENDTESSPSAYKPVELEDGPHFIGESEETSEALEPATEGSAEPIPNDADEIDSSSPLPTPEEREQLSQVPLDVSEEISEEEAKEFQEAQDQIFSAFLELSALQEQMRKAREEAEAKAAPSASEGEEGTENDDKASEEDSRPEDLEGDVLEPGEYEADLDIDGVGVRSLPARKAENGDDKS